MSADLQARLIHAFNRNDWPVVQKLAVQLLPLAPGQAMAPFMAGVAHMQLQQLEQAAGFLEQAMQLEPSRADFAAQYAKALALMGRMSEARRIADCALALSPADPFTLDTLGVVYIETHMHERALQVFRREVAMAPDRPLARFNLAYAHIAMGDDDAAERELEHCVRLEPRHWIAHWRLASLRRQAAERNHIERLRGLLARYPADPGAQLYLNLALAKEYEDLGDYPVAFEHYCRGKQVGRESRRGTAQRDAGIIERLVQSFPAISGLPASGVQDSAPIFIIGMPRTGTTLLDRILSSHPQVHSAGELREFPSTLQRLSGSRMPVLMDPQLPSLVRAMDWRLLGETYLAATREHAQHAPHFIDKLPHNFLYAGFIARALPNAKIVCLRRNPLDTCLGNFRHLFEQQSSYYAYSFDLLDTGRYYAGFDRLMAHWQRVFPGRIFELHYESLVDSQESATRQLLDFLGLPWNDACMQSERNAAPVNTPNAWQVRAPVYRSALGRWKHYETQLSPLRDLFASSGIDVAA
ncbi:sulfotransferase [Dyella jejuensis]|uniref:Sulfotransferase n=1 Tax=Dyella jejuensis TaxID=1432009 RepID=A0ABW8JQE1_9GAMM